MSITDQQVSEGGATASRHRLLTRRTLLVTCAVIVSVLLLFATVAAFVVLHRSPVDNRVLVADESGAISLLDPDTGQAAFRVPDAVATPDRSALLTTREAGDRTVLESRDPGTGTVTGSTTLGGSVGIRTVSPSGGAVALVPHPSGAGLYEPEPRAATSITVAYTDDRPSRTYELDGNFEPEMFSLDESLLFLLEFVPATAPDGYLVRQLDLGTGEITDTGAPQVVLNPKMGGKARAQVLHPDGTHLYTLYTVPSDGTPVHDVDAAPGEDPERWAFVHVINLDEQWSYCIFLPVPMGTVDEAAVGMAISPDGSTLYVGDASTSTVALVDAVDLAVREVEQVDQLRDSGSPAVLAVASDGTVYAASGTMLLELESGSLTPVASWSHGGTITAVAMSASGDEVRVGTSDRITVVDRASRQEVSVIEPPGDGAVHLLGPPRGSVTEFPLECAC
jgi:DNA-binding beta-propeller fold protein YncE